MRVGRPLRCGVGDTGSNPVPGTTPTAALGNSRICQVVGVISHLIELALVEIVVPEVAVRDLELTSRRFGGPPCGGLDPLVDG